MISRRFFQSVVWFSLGVFAWSGYVQITMLCGLIPKLSALSLAVSVLGIVAAICALHYEDQWFADDGKDWRADK